MQQFVVVNYGLNQVYTVHKQAFIQSIEYSFAKNPYVKLDNDIEITINENLSNVDITLSFYTKGNKKLSEVADKILNTLQEGVKFLIGAEAQNIKLLYKGKTK